jgi:MFS transporter, DHA1 family, multidrug resistance protein
MPDTLQAPPTAPACPPAASAAPAPSAALVATALALLLGLQPLTTDLYLPTLPALAREFGAPMTAVQLTMSALLLSFGLAQLVWGPLADRFGRRPVLLSGLGLYLLASVAAVLAPTIAWLVAARAVQGAAMAAAVVCARAMVRDLYAPHEGAHVMSKGLSGLGVIAVLGPLAGGFIGTAFGWRGALATVALVGAATFAFVWRRVPETARVLRPDALHLQPLARTWAQILRHPTFLAWAGLTACTYGGLFVILAGSPFVYIGVLGAPVSAYGALLASGSFAYLVGTFVCRRWLVAHGTTGAVRRGAVFTLAGGLSMAALAAAGVQSVWAILVPQWLFCFAHGIHQPCGQTGAIGPFPQAAGTASALAGFVLAATAFGIGLWLGAALGPDTRAFAFGVGFWAVLTSAVAWTVVQRFGRAVPAPESGRPRSAPHDARRDARRDA